MELVRDLFHHDQHSLSQVLDGYFWSQFKGILQEEQRAFSLLSLFPF
jgi:hypothetical protein